MRHAEDMVPLVRITADPRRFAPLLGGGFRLSGAGGLALEAFLVAEAGIPADYLRERVQTLFMDGRPVDDAGTAVVREGGVISLSAAMPGLAGAVLRRSGVYAAMRRSISHDPAAPASRDRGRIGVTLKLFNLIARELGPEIRVNGVAPGTILWPESEPWQDEVSRQRIINQTALKRIGEPDDIAKAVEFLIAHATYVTGQIIAVDGGRSVNL